MIQKLLFTLLTLSGSLAGASICGAGCVYYAQHCLCETAAADPDLDGVYDMQLTIGDKVFNDEMLLEPSPAGPLHLSYRGPVAGRITVPGAFSSPLSGNLTCHPWEGVCELGFVITAHESGRDYQVFYEGKLEIFGERLFTGTAKLARGEFLGNFTARKRKTP